MSNPTPGPWFEDYAVAPEHMAKCLLENPTWVAVADNSDDGGHVAYCAPDNAPVISAAPCMFVVLKEAVEAANADQYEQCWYADARSIIAKVEGQVMATDAEAIVPELLAALKDMLDMMGPLDDISMIRRKRVAQKAVAKAEAKGL